MFLSTLSSSPKELDATAVYHGLATKHPLVPKFARQMRHEERSGMGRESISGETGGSRGGRELGDVSRRPSTTASGRRDGSVSRGGLERSKRTSKVTTNPWETPSLVSSLGPRGDAGGRGHHLVISSTISALSPVGLSSTGRSFNTYGSVSPDSDFSLSTLSFSRLFSGSSVAFEAFWQEG